MLTLQSQGLGAAGTWSTAVPKGGGRNIVKLNLSGEDFWTNFARVGPGPGLGPSPGWGPVRVGAHMGPYGPLWDRTEADV